MPSVEMQTDSPCVTMTVAVSAQKVIADGAEERRSPKPYGALIPKKRWQ